MVARKLTVQVSDAKVSCHTEDVLVTYSLGSCIGVCLYDPMAKIGGMLHYQLPDSRIDPPKAKANPFMFADSGLHLLVKKLVSMGGQAKRMQVKIAGGATMDAGPKGFDIGKRNHIAIRKLIWRQQLLIKAEDVGGSWPRSLRLHLDDGKVTVKSNGEMKELN
jgi:chemotaxis protein CheD